MKRSHFYFYGFIILALCDTLTKFSFKLTALSVGDFDIQTSWLLHVLHSPWLYVAILGYVGSFITWMTLLRYAPVGLAFAASHLDVIPVLTISVLYFRESLNTLQGLGAVMIVLGIACLGCED